jgi:undecaprenyl phosphate-alpha-L-ara4N flippase subunit ArnE
MLLGVSGLLMLFSMLVAVWVLRTIQLSQLVPFAAGAYVLVPLGGRAIFNEQLHPRLWFGVIAIMGGIYLTLSS